MTYQCRLEFTVEANSSKDAGAAFMSRVLEAFMSLNTPEQSSFNELLLNHFSYKELP
jgi:hypothetical protein